MFNHAGKAQCLHLDATQRSTLPGPARKAHSAPWTAMDLGLSGLISFGFFLLQLSSKCQNAELAGPGAWLKQTCAQSYPQKLCVESTVAWAIIQTHFIRSEGTLAFHHTSRRLAHLAAYRMLDSCTGHRH
jgi:hypothetical protein